MQRQEEPTAAVVDADADIGVVVAEMLTPAELPVSRPDVTLPADSIGLVVRDGHRHRHRHRHLASYAE